MIASPEIKRLSNRITKPRFSARPNSNSHRFDLGIEETSRETSSSRKFAAREPQSDVERSSSSSAAIPQPHCGAPPYIRALYRTTLFSPEEERATFRLLAQLRTQAQDLRAAIADDPDLDQMAELNAIDDSIVAVRNSIIEANLRLVVSVAKRFVGKGRPDFTELISEGNDVIMRAVDLFDAEYGTRFSTYATTALQRAFMSTLKSSYRQTQRFTTGTPGAFDSIVDESVQVNSAHQVQMSHDARFLLKQLDERERFIVEGRFGFASDTNSKTFRELGEALGLSKERIRQLLIKALEKLKEAAEKNRISLPESFN